jgi:hypothetical protein
LCALTCGFASAATADDENGWQEGLVTLPPFPEDADLIEFYVSAVATNRFLIDAKSLGVGEDGVVRYTLVVLTAGGATNVTHEGMRCTTREFKLYAAGRSDRSWSAIRGSSWRPIENKPINRHHAALSRDHFCPMGNPVQTSAEGRDALRRGKHPSAP